MPSLAQPPRVAEKIKRLGNCIELVSIDPHFHDVSVGLFIKDGVMTISTYSTIDGVEARIEQIRDRCVKLGDVEAVEGATDQLRLVSDLYLDRALRFMFIAAVEKDPAQELPSGRITAPDTKTKLTLVVEGAEEDGQYVYTVSTEGEAERAVMRVRATVGGFIRYSGCVRVDKNKFSFPDGKQYDNFARLILPLARNVSAVEAQLEADEMAGQMNTQTLGFAQS
ncbi:hypothetical protein [Candidatus Lucifugimonas marina]|jgi:hypothetical protein|uniref:Uncharacterized protein n=1 Tax=Candidatus Lucifugimonas marina TaxID=3038979 RepID=A0AAJ5ZHB6_9CHLR|nr:hypothetical protein [SAR202 cluster bacterium JH702]MDG0868797.1 hypothetical protein [SAR202 cluster bacterium JH639]WFG35428.1 hypothetical protein GKN94_06880 [SAR202 cluster bacterium JH545]WFG39375.1 hypothetical protein GKO48_06995 [SAR202 cluster bacterium JH1073]